MNKKLKEAFDQVRAEDALKEKTKAFVFQKTKGYTRAKTGNARRLIPAAACLLLLLLGGYRLYFTPTVQISMDINPSIELGINRFDRVVSASGRNQDGKDLLELLDIKYLNYTDAVNEILDCERITALLSSGEIMTIYVIGPDGEQSSRILSGVDSCTEEESNTHCYHASAEEAEEARDLGLPYGKYRIFLEIQALDPNITAEEVQGMTMQELRDLLNSLSEDSGQETQAGAGSGHHGTGGGHGHGHE